MQVKYIGPLPGVIVPEYNRDVVVAHDEVIEVDDELAERMLEQPTNWTAAGRAPKGPEVKKVTTAHEEDAE